MSRIDKSSATLKQLKARPLPPEPAADANAAMGYLRDVFSASRSAASKLTEAVPEPGRLGRLWSGIRSLPGKLREMPSLAVNGWLALAMGVSSKPFETRKLIDDPSDANELTRGNIASAKAALKSRSGVEQAALDKLSSPRREQFQRVAASLNDSPVARRALQKMLLDGRLDGKDLKGDQDLLTRLDGLARQPLTDGLKPNQLLAEVVIEVENPVRISQEDKLTCGATTAQILLARRSPAEYVRLLQGLASPEGKATMAGGGALHRKADWQADNDGGRTLSSRLFQPAVMQHAEPLPGDRYDNTEDRNKLGPIPLQSGLFTIGSTYSELTGEPYGDVIFLAFNRSEAWNDVKNVLTEGKGPIPVGMRWTSDDTPGFHFVLVDEVKDGVVTITNPYGKREAFGEAEFRARVTSAVVPK